MNAKISLAQKSFLALWLAFLSAGSAQALNLKRDCPCEFRWSASALGLTAGENIDSLAVLPNGDISISSRTLPSLLARSMGAPFVQRVSQVRRGDSGPETWLHRERQFKDSLVILQLSWTREPEVSWLQALQKKGVNRPSRSVPATLPAIDPASLPYIALLGQKIGPSFQRLWLSKGQPNPTAFVWETTEAGVELMEDPKETAERGGDGVFSVLIRQSDGLPLSIRLAGAGRQGKITLNSVIGKDGTVLYRKN